MKRRFRIPIYAQILIGMFIGIAVGMVAIEAGGRQIVCDWVKPWGQIFIRLLQLIAIPLIFVTLVKGVTGLTDISRLSKMGLKTICIYIVTTVIAILLGVTAVSLVKPGKYFDAGKTVEMQQAFSKTIDIVVEEQYSHGDGPLMFLFEIVPSNIFDAASDNRRMLQVIFFALLFGVAALSVGKKKAKPVVKLIDSLNVVVLKIVDFIIRTAPYGVMALMAGLVVDSSGNFDLFVALALYGVTVIGCFLFICVVFYPLLVKFFTRIPVRRFLKELFPAQLLAFTTSSSAATLPVTMDVAKNRLNIPEETCSFVLPIGATVNMDGTSCFQAISVIFIAQVLGLDLTMGQLLTIILMTTISSIGTPSIPGGSYVILTMVLSSVGIPAQGLALILGVDRPLDMMRTSVNVTGDVVVSALIAPTKEHNV